MTARDFLPQKIDAGQGPDPVLSAHERLVEQTQRVWVECHPQHLWMAVSGWWRRFVTADEIVASHGPGALFMAGYADVVHTTWYPLCDGALVNIMLGRRRANDRDDEVLAAAYDQICQHRGALELTPGRHEDYYFPYLIECVFGLPSALGSDVTPPTFKQALAPRDRRRNCWVLAACVERNEHQAQASPSDIVGRQLTNRGPKHALEAVVLARHRPRRSSRLDDPLAAIRRTSREMLAKVDPELVQWANGDLTIWADPKG